MMAEKEGLCLSQDQVHMICGMGTNLQRKMDAALKQCMPREMMAATMDDMSMSPDIKLLSSGRAFDFEEVSERGNKKKVAKKMKGKKGKKSKKPKKPSKKPKEPSKKPSKKPSGFKSCESSCPSMDEMRASALEEMETELCVLNAIGWIDAEGNMKQDMG